MLKLSLALILTSWISMAYSADGHVMVSPTDVQFAPGPETLPAGAQISVIAGDPKAKGPFTMRLKFPANYQVPPHWHSKDENITVIEGEFLMGMGDVLSESKAFVLPTGGYGKMPAKVRHFAIAGKRGAVVQVHGEGPFDIFYVNVKDDPRKKK